MEPFDHWRLERQDDDDTFGAAVRWARLQDGVTRIGLARRTGLAARTITRIESGAKASAESRRLLSDALSLARKHCEAGADATVGHRLRDLRRSRNLSLSMLAFTLGDVSEAKLSRVERGLSKPQGGWANLLTDDYALALGFKRAKELCKILGVDA